MSSECPFHTTRAQASLSNDFDAFTFLSDPHPILNRARKDAPVFYDESTGHWVITRYETIKAMLSDTETYSSVNALDPICPLDARVPQTLEAGGFGGRPFIVNLDGEAHSETKRIMSKVLHPRAVAAFEPRIRALAQEMLGALPQTEPFDFVDRFALEFPALVIFEFLGLPAEVVREVKGWADARLELFFGSLPADRQATEAHGIVEFWRFIEDHIDAQAQEPGDHFVGDMVRLMLDGEEQVNKNDIANYCWSFLFAGHETTTGQLGSMVRDILLQRDAWEAVVAEPAKITKAVEESLRMNTSVFNWRRRSTCDTEIEGVTVPAGANLFLVYGSANRDPEQFPDPDTFDIDREGLRKHIGLGFGAHFCVGAGLARLQLKIVLEELSALMPDLQLVPDAEQRYIDNVSFCGPRSLMLTAAAA